MSAVVFSRSLFARQWRASDVGDASDAGGGARGALAGPFATAYRSLRSIDGIDEFTSLMGQLLPQLGQAIASLTILSAATPFVAVGAMGAVDDCSERFRETYPEILRTLHEQRVAIMQALEREGRAPAELAQIRQLFDQAQRLHELSAEAPASRELQDLDRARFFARFCRTSTSAAPVLRHFKRMDADDRPPAPTPVASASASVPPRKRSGLLAWLRRLLRLDRPDTSRTSRAFSQEAGRLAADSASALLRQRVTRYELLERQRQTERIDRDFSVAGAGAMLGMTGGMVVASGNAVADIVAATAPAASQASAQAASAGLAIAAGAVFLPSQLAMAAYGGARLATGLKRRAQLQADAQALARRSVDFDIDTRTGPVPAGVHSVLRRERRYNRLNFIAYGGVTVTGQALMAGGNLLNLSGAGAPAGVALSAIGAPLTIAGAVLRAVAEHKERKYAGDGASVIAQDMAQAMGRRHAGARARTRADFAAAFRQARRHYVGMQDRVAASKLDQLVLKALDKEAGDQSSSALDVKAVVARRRAAVLQAMDRLEQRPLRSHRSGLLDADLTVMRQLFTPVNYPDSLFAGSKADVRQRLLEYMRQQTAACARELRQDVQADAVADEVVMPPIGLDEQGDAAAPPISNAASDSAARQGDLAWSDALGQQAFRRAAADFMRMKSPLLRQEQQRFARKGRMTRAHFDILRNVPAYGELRAAYSTRLAVALNRQLIRDARYLRRQAALDVIQLAHGLNAIAGREDRVRF